MLSIPRHQIKDIVNYRSTEGQPRSGRGRVIHSTVKTVDSERGRFYTLKDESRKEIIYDVPEDHVSLHVNLSGGNIT